MQWVVIGKAVVSVAHQEIVKAISWLLGSSFQTLENMKLRSVDDAQSIIIECICIYYNSSLYTNVTFSQYVLYTDVLGNQYMKS